jgi:transposase
LTNVDKKTSFERVCRTEKDVKIKERMLLVLNVVYYGRIASQVARTLHKSKGWASQWLKRYKRRRYRWVERQTERRQTFSNI